MPRILRREVLGAAACVFLAGAAPAAAAVAVRLRLPPPPPLTAPLAADEGLFERLDASEALIRRILGPDSSLETIPADRYRGSVRVYRSARWNAAVEAGELSRSLESLRAMWGDDVSVDERDDAGLEAAEAPAPRPLPRAEAAEFLSAFPAAGEDAGGAFDGASARGPVRPAFRVDEAAERNLARVQRSIDRAIPRPPAMGGGFSFVPDADRTSAAIRQAPPWVRQDLHVLGASLAFSLFDYFGYNLSKGDPATLSLYRKLQLAVQAGLTYWLYRNDGAPAAAAFNLIWWTFGDDFLYFGIAEAARPTPGWDGPGSFSKVTNDQVNYAGWTPVGLLRGGNTGEVISGRTLILQAGVGLSLAMLLPLLFQ